VQHYLAQRGDRVLNVLHAQVFIESLIELEGLLPILGRIAKLHARLLPPEQIRHQHDVAFLCVVISDLAHADVHTKNFLRNHQPGAFTGSRLGEIGTEFATTIASFYLDHA